MNHIIKQSVIRLMLLTHKTQWWFRSVKCKKKAWAEAATDQWKNCKDELNRLIQLHWLIQASDRVKSQASDACESATESQWESTETDVQDDKLDNQAECDQIDITDAQDVTVI